MSGVLTKIEFVSWVHLKPITIEAPHIPFNQEHFKTGITGFERHSLKKTISWFGARRYGLVDVSGLVPHETRERIKQDYEGSQTKVDMMTFLQSLDWIHNDHHKTQFNFSCIVAYTTAGEAPMVARPTTDGFASVPHPNDDPWPTGTLCLFLPSEL